MTASALHYSQSGNVKGDISAQLAKVKFQQPTIDDYVSVIPATQQQQAELQSTDSPAIKEKTGNHKITDPGYYYVLKRAQGDGTEEEYVLEKRRCATGMPICTLRPSERQKNPLIEN